MGFLTGSVTYQRFRVAGPVPRQFDQADLDKLADHMAVAAAVVAGRAGAVSVSATVEET